MKTCEYCECSDIFASIMDKKIKEFDTLLESGNPPKKGGMLEFWYLDSYYPADKPSFIRNYWGGLQENRILLPRLSLAT